MRKYYIIFLFLLFAAGIYGYFFSAHKAQGDSDAEVCHGRACVTLASDYMVGYRDETCTWRDTSTMWCRDPSQCIGSCLFSCGDSEICVSPFHGGDGRFRDCSDGEFHARESVSDNCHSSWCTNAGTSGATRQYSQKIQDNYWQYTCTCHWISQVTRWSKCENNIQRARFDGTVWSTRNMYSGRNAVDCNNYNSQCVNVDLSRSCVYEDF